LVDNFGPDRGGREWSGSGVNRSLDGVRLFVET
jgi:hypothetical protein